MLLAQCCYFRNWLLINYPLSVYLTFCMMATAVSRFRSLDKQNKQTNLTNSSIFYDFCRYREWSDTIRLFVSRTRFDNKSNNVSSWPLSVRRLLRGEQSASCRTILKLNLWQRKNRLRNVIWFSNSFSVGQNSKESERHSNFWSVGFWAGALRSARSLRSMQPTKQNWPEIKTILEQLLECPH